MAVPNDDKVRGSHAEALDADRHVYDDGQVGVCLPRDGVEGRLLPAHLGLGRDESEQVQA